jgi:hypothetical protein
MAIEIAIIVLGCIVQAVVVEIIIEITIVVELVVEITTVSEIRYQVAGAKTYLQASECQLMETHPARETYPSSYYAFSLFEYLRKCERPAS